MTFSYGALAGLIAAGAFLLLVLCMIPLLVHSSKGLKEASKTIENANDILIKLGHNSEELMQQSQDLMDKTNTLLADINDKMKTVQPVVKAAADLGESVSKLNASSQRAVKRFSARRASRAGLLSTFLATVLARRKRRRGED